jgi:hypothetical protein
MKIFHFSTSFPALVILCISYPYMLVAYPLVRYFNTPAGLPPLPLSFPHRSLRPHGHALPRGDDAELLLPSGGPSLPAPAPLLPPRALQRR